jgi:hypothetical protein
MAKFKKMAAVLLAAVFVFMFSCTAFAQVKIDESQSVSQIQRIIQRAINEAGDNGTVYVNGKKNGAENTLSLRIPEGKTLVWQAEYTGLNNALAINLKGKGSFEVTSGGALKALHGYGTVYSYAGDIRVTDDAIVTYVGANGSALGTFDGNIAVNGGSISAAGTHTAAVRSSGTGGITVIGGLVSGRTAIHVHHGAAAFFTDNAAGMFSSTGRGLIAEVTEIGGSIEIRAGRGDVRWSLSGREYAEVVFVLENRTEIWLPLY